MTRNRVGFISPAELSAALKLLAAKIDLASAELDLIGNGSWSRMPQPLLVEIQNELRAFSQDVDQVLQHHAKRRADREQRAQTTVDDAAGEQAAARHTKRKK